MFGSVTSIAARTRILFRKGSTTLYRIVFVPFLYVLIYISIAQSARRPVYRHLCKKMFLFRVFLIVREIFLGMCVLDASRKVRNVNSKRRQGIQYRKARYKGKAATD
ncbi:hypothetical protein CPB84DRAFT_1405511 [Gymnopilus junonius]|uniref:Uncharacterized protein n=1 Tax=Gymnopilus junonius TaxID=109634 RepID=A0A9P5TJW5_GYMJU|nr:hypothetical protein CPB84DRAFT_1405511 [Gymnopilus junonius]